MFFTLNCYVLINIQSQTPNFLFILYISFLLTSRVIFRLMSSFLLNELCEYSVWTSFQYYNRSDLLSHSQCLKHLLLIWIPSVFFWLMAPFFAFQILLMHRNKSFDPLPWQRLIVFKLLLTLLAILGGFLLTPIYPI